MISQNKDPIEQTLARVDDLHALKENVSLSNKILYTIIDLKAWIQI